ncbi:C-type mannose receptor 2-like [Tachysurus fulvidraco]|uniref:C-type mannose receptor 2-like n=1 Tax=Tachysurus fulvidraco TaxID=1234273 RepID=UPI000F4DC165|nr:C-type mannose receptor 2-like [Tachysurus fulvidraco]
MALHLSILLFFSATVSFSLSISRKYYLIQQAKNWTDAQAYCKATHTDLAIIQSNEEMVQLMNEAQRQKFISNAWIGLYNDINSWRWSMGNEPLGSVRQWDTDEPNNSDGHQECSVIEPSGWNDRPCTEENNVVCFDNTKTGTDRYIYINNLMTWPEAQAYCRMMYTDLASDRDATENSVILGVIGDWSWIGLFRDSWKWTDQTKMSTISWMSGEPDNLDGNEDCSYINNGQAADAQCSDIMPFFCYSLTKTQQIMAVNVRSNQDINDPAVNAAILDQIRQKLKDHGMAENITVKWRKQADGKVFHKKEEIYTK